MSNGTCYRVCCQKAGNLKPENWRPFGVRGASETHPCCCVCSCCIWRMDVRCANRRPGSVWRGGARCLRWRYSSGCRRQNRGWRGWPANHGTKTFASLRTAASWQWMPARSASKERPAASGGSIGRLMAAPATWGEVYNIGGTEEISILALANRIKKVTGNAPIELIPYAQAFDSNFQDMPRRVPDVHKLAAPSPVPIFR